MAIGNQKAIERICKINNSDPIDFYDDRLIVSQKFKNFYDSNGYSSDRFSLVNDIDQLYLFEPKEILTFDTEKRETQFIDYCNSCNQYESIVGATPVFLEEIISPLTKGFYRTDVEFGSAR